MTTKWTWLKLANLFLSYLILYYGKWYGAEIRFQFSPGKNNPPKLLKSTHVLCSLGEVWRREPLACIATGVFPLLHHLPLDNRGQGPLN